MTVNLKKRTECRWQFR